MDSAAYELIVRCVLTCAVPSVQRVVSGLCYILIDGHIFPVVAHVGGESLQWNRASGPGALPGQIRLAAAAVGLIDGHGGGRNVTPLMQVGGGRCVPLHTGSHGNINYIPVGVSLYVLLQSQRKQALIMKDNSLS